MEKNIIGWWASWQEKIVNIFISKDQKTEYIHRRELSKGSSDWEGRLPARVQSFGDPVFVGS